MSSFNEQFGGDKNDSPRTDNLLHLLIGAFHETDYPSIVNLCRQLERENAALRADKERLEWAEAHPEIAMREIQTRWQLAGRGFRENKFYFRRAIDAARQKPPID